MCSITYARRQGNTLMNSYTPLHQLKDCAALSTRLNRIAVNYGVITHSLAHSRYLHLYSLLCGRSSYHDFQKDTPSELNPDYSNISEIVNSTVKKGLSDDAILSIDHDVKFIISLAEEIIRASTYKLSELDIMSLKTIRDGLAFQKLCDSKPRLAKHLLYADSFRSISKIEIVKADTKLLCLKSYQRITRYIYQQVVDKKDFMSLFQLVFAHEYIPIADENCLAKVRVADWFNDADEDGEQMRQKAFHKAWTENFDPRVEIKNRFFLNDNANSFQRPISLYDTLEVYMNPNICAEYVGVN